MGPRTSVSWMLLLFRCSLVAIPVGWSMRLLRGRRKLSSDEAEWRRRRGLGIYIKEYDLDITNRM